MVKLVVILCVLSIVVLPLRRFFFWDKCSSTLLNQTTQPIQDHKEMGFSGTNGDPDLAALISKLKEIRASFPALKISELYIAHEFSLLHLHTINSRTNFIYGSISFSYVSSHDLQEPLCKSVHLETDSSSILLRVIILIKIKNY